MITLGERLCITVKVVQYCEGIPSVPWRNTISTVEEYHQYFGGVPSVYWRNTVSTMKECHQYFEGYHQYIGRCSILWKKFSTVTQIILVSLCRSESPPQYRWNSPTALMESLRSTKHPAQYWMVFLQSTEHPSIYGIVSPTILMASLL